MFTAQLLVVSLPSPRHSNLVVSSVVEERRGGEGLRFSIDGGPGEEYTTVIDVPLIYIQTPHHHLGEL